MLSMTGYGRAASSFDGRQLTVELKSVNHRFLDLAFRMPRNFAFLEDDMRKAISARLARGHVEVYVSYRNLRVDARYVEVDRALLNAYGAALDALAGEGLADDRSVMQVAQLPGLLNIAEADEDEETLRALALQTLEAALDALVAMRKREGAVLREDMERRANAVQSLSEEIEARYPETLKLYAERLHESILALAGQELDEQRMVTEIALMADKTAINEELVRLRCHVIQLRDCLSAGVPVGRKLDFLLQEFNREVNTIASKSQDIQITRLTVGLKGELEKLREQAQNVE